MPTCCCAIVGCTNHTIKLRAWRKQFCFEHNKKHEDCPCNEPFTLRSFPTNPEKRSQWVKAVNRKDLKTGRNWLPKQKYDRICSKHFILDQDVPTEQLGHSSTSVKPGRQKLVTRKRPRKVLLDEEVSQIKTEMVVNLPSSSERLPSSSPSEGEKWLPKQTHHGTCSEHFVPGQEVPAEKFGHSLLPTPHTRQKLVILVPSSKPPHSGLLSIKKLKTEHSAPVLSIKDSTNTSIVDFTSHNTTDHSCMPIRITNVTSIVNSTSHDHSYIMCTNEKCISNSKSIQVLKRENIALKEIEAETDVAKMKLWQGSKSQRTSKVVSVHHDNIGLSPRKKGKPKKCSLKDEILMCLMRLKLNLHVEDLADRFHISKGQCSKIITTWNKEPGLLSKCLKNQMWKQQK